MYFTYTRSLHLYTFKCFVNCIRLHKIRSLIISSAIIVTKSNQKTSNAINEGVT